MEVLAIIGSARKCGNTSTLTKIVFKEFGKRRNRN